MSDDTDTNKFAKFLRFIFNLLDVPVTTFREKVVEPLHSGKRLQYYHRRYPRVPTIDECEVGDEVCYFEANEQFRRDRLVEEYILKILRQRKNDCFMYHGPHDKDKYCKKVVADYKTAETNWFTKYGDMGAKTDVVAAYMKQKHRLIWERRHGPVGSGMKKDRLATE